MPSTSRFTASGTALRCALCLLVLLFLARAALAGQARYVFLFIGDGMGLAQVSAAGMYRAVFEGEAGAGAGKLSFASFPAQGVTTTPSHDSPVTDSAAAGTAIACGVKTRNSFLGVDADGRSVPSVAEMARDAGMKVGIVTSVSLDHATPAAFYTHRKGRSSHYEIGLDLAASRFDYFAGGGFLDPDGRKSKKAGEKIGVTDAVAKAGYAFVDDMASFDALKSGARAVVAAPGLQGDGAMPYAIDAGEGDVTLADLTAKGIEVLDNPRGFFMMVEAGKIDWACHAHDAMAAIGEVLALEAAVDKAVEFAAGHPDETLIVVTADHETGGLALDSPGTGHSPHIGRLRGQKVSHAAFGEEFAAWRKANPGAPFARIAGRIEASFGLKAPSEPGLAEMAGEPGGSPRTRRSAAEDDMRLNAFELEGLKAAYARSMSPGSVPSGGREKLPYGGKEPFVAALINLVNQKAGLAWTSSSHTGVPVPVSASGVDAASFNGLYDNTGLHDRIIAAMGLDAPKAGGRAANRGGGAQGRP